MDDSPRTASRRAVLTSIAAAGSLGVASRSSAVHRSEDFGVTFEYDKDWLETYQPALIASYATRTAYQGFYGAKATADDYEFDVGVFWLRLTHQEGLPGVPADAHNRDHEPIYVFVDGDGAVDSHVYSEWHHSAETLSGTALQNALFADRTSDPTHLAYQVVEEWHNYVPKPGASDAEWEFLEVGDFTQAIDDWKRNGYFEATSDEAVYDPASMRTRDTWWKKDTWDYRMVNALQYPADLMGLWGGDEADL